jgi:hypothetical protein
MPRRNTSHQHGQGQQERVVVEAEHVSNHASTGEQGLVNEKTFEETVVKVEVYESERAITCSLDDYEENSEEERRLVRKIDRRLLPVLGAMFLWQSLDRTGMNGNAMTAKARQLYRDDNGYASSIWVLFAMYIGTVIGSNVMLSHTRPSRYLPALVLVGGILNAMTSMAGSATTIVVYRFPVTIIEAVLFPGILYQLSCWYKPSELGKRIAMFPSIAIVAQIIGTLVSDSQGMSTRHQILNSIGVLRYMFFVDGVLSILTALVAFSVLPDYPAISKAFTRRERELATIRLVHREQDTGSSASRGYERLSTLEAIFASIRDPRVIVISIVAVLASAAGTAGHMLLTSTIQTGYSSVRVHRFAIATHLITLVVMNVFSATSDRTRDRRWHVHGALGMAIVGAALTTAVGPQHHYARVVLTTLYSAGIWSAVPLTLTWAAVVIKHPAEKRAVVLALVHALSGAACVFGVQMWPRMLGGRQHVASAMTTTFLAIALLVAFLVPEFIRLEMYKGTRAERDQELRRKDMEQMEQLDEVEQY